MILGNSNPANPGLILGSRIITPSTLLRVDPSGNCGANESSLTWNVQGPQGPQGPKGDPTYIRTIIVNNTNDATTDGNALLSAMTLISNASPSRTKSYLLKLEPGVYDIGNNSLNLVPFVDLEGSGEGNTAIVSTIDSASPPTTGVLNLASDTEVRLLSIYNVGESNYITTVYARSGLVRASLDNVTISPILGGTLESYGLYTAIDTEIKVQNSTITVAINGSYPASQNLNVFGIDSHGKLTVQNSTIWAYNQYGRATYAIRSSSTANKETIIQQSNLTAFRGSELTRALDIGGSAKVTVQNSNLSASGIKLSHNTAIYNNGTAASIVQNSTLMASGGDITTTNRAIVNLNTLRVGASEVAGGIDNTGDLKCVASYNADFDPITNGCI